jgi:phosphohistidine phosphatase SixA
VTIFLIRHASAGKRSGESDDWLRPLDARGHDQANALARNLGDRELARVMSSPALRCQQTVGALAQICGVEVEVEDSLAEGSSDRAVIKLMASLAGADAALCSHGDVIPEVIRALEGRGMKIKGDRGWKKGAVWAVQMRDGVAVSARYTPTV